MNLRNLSQLFHHGKRGSGVIILIDLDTNIRTIPFFKIMNEFCLILVFSLDLTADQGFE